MARRRRLDAPSTEEMARIRADAASREQHADFATISSSPIARVAADSVAAQRAELDALRAEATRNRSAAQTLAAAEAAGGVVRDIALDDIEVDYLTRDRLRRMDEDEAWLSLRASIQAHGQRTPLDLANIAHLGGRPYGLISGYRRISVLSALAAETGERRWQVAKALVRAPTTLGQAFLGMVEENEIREGLSYFERGRICLAAVDQGAFENVGAALEMLFGAASPAKRSKIRSFVLVVEELGDLLRFPKMLGERLGLRLAQAIKAGQGGALRRRLGEEGLETQDASAEQRLLEAALADERRLIRPPSSARRLEWRSALADGRIVTARRGVGGVVMQVDGRAPTDAQIEAALKAWAAALAVR